MTKKKRSAKRDSNGAETPPGVTTLYPLGTPLDDAGFPRSGAEIDPAIAKTLPLDKKSARQMHQYRETVRKKASGEKNVRWDTEEHIKFQQLLELQPGTKIRIEQTAPVEDKSLAAQDVTAFRTYEDMLEFVRKFHWRGDAAAYKWVAFDDHNPVWAQGTFKFAARQENEDDDMARNQQPPPGYGYPPPSYGYPPPQGYPPAGYPPLGYPPAGYPPVGYPYYSQPTPQPAPAPQPAATPQPMPMPPQPQPVIVTPAPMPPGASPDTVGQLIGSLSQSQAQVAALQEQLRQVQLQQLQQAQAQQLAQQMQAAQVQQQPAQQQAPQPQWNPQFNAWMQWSPQLNAWVMLPGQMAQQQPAAQSAQQEPPPKPKTDLEIAAEAFQHMKRVAQLGRTIAAEFSPDADTDAAPAAPTALPQEDMPLKVQEVGPVRFVTRKDNTPVDATTQFMFNFDKIGDLAKQGFKEVKELLKERSEAVAKAEAAKAQTAGAPEIDPQEVALQKGERLLAMRREELRLQEHEIALAQRSQQLRAASHPPPPQNVAPHASPPPAPVVAGPPPTPPVVAGPPPAPPPAQPPLPESEPEPDPDEEDEEDLEGDADEEAESSPQIETPA